MASSSPDRSIRACKVAAGLLKGRYNGSVQIEIPQQRSQPTDIWVIIVVSLCFVSSYASSPPPSPSLLSHAFSRHHQRGPQQHCTKLAFHRIEELEETAAVPCRAHPWQESFTKPELESTSKLLRRPNTLSQPSPPKEESPMG